ncbi:hypothetical protein BDR07DRAFT_1052316 [Suillus spraguei]|nr:hypothetical protein BDR07DRAFT_1052316 [Suillus spraguei]
MEAPGLFKQIIPTWSIQTIEIELETTSRDVSVPFVIGRLYVPIFLKVISLRLFMPWTMPGFLVIASCIIVSCMCSILSISHMSLSISRALFFPVHTHPDLCRLPVIITAVSSSPKHQTRR